MTRKTGKKSLGKGRVSARPGRAGEMGKDSVLAESGRAGEMGKGRVPREKKPVAGQESLSRQTQGGRVQQGLGWAGEIARRGNLLVLGSVALDSVKTPFGEVSEVLGGS